MQQTLLQPHGLFAHVYARRHQSYSSCPKLSLKPAKLKLQRNLDGLPLSYSWPFRCSSIGQLAVRVKAEASPGTRETGYGSYTAVEDAAEINMRNQVAKRLEETARHFKRLGSLGFWGQFLCTIVSAVILAFSVAVSGTATAPITIYLTAAGIVAGFISVFWSFGYMRLSGRLEGSAGDPSKAPPRAQVVDKLKTGLIINVLGMASTVVGLQATLGLLVAKALNSPAASFLQGPYAGQSPVLALDVFVVQACGNALLSHFLGLIFNLELLRSVTNKPPPQKVILKTA